LPQKGAKEHQKSIGNERQHARAAMGCYKLAEDWGVPAAKRD
jgi:hypothetical protein